jgi:cytochrome c oxidase subunit 3
VAISFLMTTILLGLFFLFVQACEYVYSPFSINDSIYGSIFFVATGFHGLHVLIGVILLIIALIRLFYYHLRNDQHLGFEAAAWY